MHFKSLEVEKPFVLAECVFEQMWQSEHLLVFILRLLKGAKISGQMPEMKKLESIFMAMKEDFIHMCLTCGFQM